MAVLQRLFVISDIHIDYSENQKALLSLSDEAFSDDVLVIAGDATDDLSKLEVFLAAMVAKFSKVVFVPGNHELWVKRSEYETSTAKFNAIIALCTSLGVHVKPLLLDGPERVWLVPLFTWYHTGQQGEDSLFKEKPCQEDKTFEMWSDFFVTEWPDEVAPNICDYFLAMNESVIHHNYDAPIISISHFLPRQELMLSTKAERAASSLNFKDLHPEFNFSHVAGSKGIDRQIRTLGSQLHLYGHQHRNRIRDIDGVTYLSHCMGYPKERQLGVVAEACARPLEIWNNHEGFIVSAENQ